MKTSKNLKFQIPELDDQANITVIGSALEALDDAAGDALAMNGDASSAQVTFSRADSRSNIESGSTFATIMAKISRYFADLKDAAFSSIANNDTTTSSGYVADARIVKTHGDEIDKVATQLGTYYFGTTTDGKPGYKTSANGTVNPFRNPVGTATAGDVLTGKTFANKTSDSNTGTMPNNGDVSKTVTPTGNNSASVTIPAGYTTGGTITADGATSYKAGKEAGYSEGYTAGHLPIVTSYMVRSGTYQGVSSESTVYVNVPEGYTTLTVTAAAISIYGSIQLNGNRIYSSSVGLTLVVKPGSTITIEGEEHEHESTVTIQLT